MKWGRPQAGIPVRATTTIRMENKGLNNSSDPENEEGETLRRFMEQHQLDLADRHRRPSSGTLGSGV